MKASALIMLLALAIYVPVHGQTEQKKSEAIRDSLWTAVYNFSKVVDEYLDNDIVRPSDVNDFLSYVYTHMPDSVQSSDSFIPYTVSKDTAFAYLQEQTKDMIGNKCEYTFVSWDGWDGQSPYTAFRLNITHNGYQDQLMVIVSTTDEIHCIFSVDSKI